MPDLPEVSFHFNAPDRLVYACRLLRKAHRQGASVLVWADEPLASELDQHLWTWMATEFVPHVRDDAPPGVRARTPILIRSADAVGTSQAPAPVLVNLRDAWPQGFESFARVIEVVTRDAVVRDLARERWRRYKSQGIEPKHLDLQAMAVG